MPLLPFGSAPQNINSLGGVPTTRTITLTGTTNQITITPTGAQDLSTDRTWTLSTPQSIATTSSPTFASLSLTSPLTVANGGTGLSSIPDGSILAKSVGGSYAAVTSTAVGTRILTNTSGGISWVLQSASVSTAYNMVTGNTGSSTASSTTDTISIIGSGAISTVAADGTPDSLTISAASATTSTLGVASFSSTNFTVSSGAVNTIQDITTGSSPTFVDVTHTGVSKLAPGLVGTPSLAFADNLDTGWYEPTTGSSGNMAGTINGSEFIRIDTVQRWSWHGATSSGNNVHTANYTATGLTTGSFMNFTFTTGATLPAFYAVLNFTAVATSSKDIRVGSFTGTANVASYAGTISSLYGAPGYSATATQTAGTSNLVGFNFKPANGTAGNYTGGTVNIIGLDVPAAPINYTGGSTVNYFAVRALGGYVAMGGTAGNTLQYTNSTTAPGTSATPVFTSYYGGNTNALGDPVGWLIVNVAGTDQKIPYY